MKKIKVLIVAGEMNVGGIENQLMHLIRHADKEKFQINFTTTASHPYYQDEIQTLGGKCIHLPKTDRIHFLRYCSALYKVLKDGEYDVIHSHELFHSGMVLLTAKIAGINCRFVHAHNCNDSIGKQKVLRKLYNSVMRFIIVHFATDFIACSCFAGKFLFGNKIVKRPNYHLVYNSVDTSKFLDRYDTQEEGGWCDDWINVIQVGRFTEVKNQLFTVEIARELKRRRKKIRILCVGNTGNQYEEKVRSKIQEWELFDYMKLLGVRKDIDSLMRKSKAFLLPSKYEGMPLVLIEAQTAGLQCIVSDTFSHEVDFEIGTVNWMKPDSNCIDWTNQIEKVVLTGRAEKSLVENAISKKKFDSKMFAQIICSLYQQAYVQRNNL